MEEISVRVPHGPDHPSPQPWLGATMSALPLETRMMALFHRGPHHTESIAKEKLLRGTKISRTLVESVKTDLPSLGGLKAPIAGPCWVCACLNLLILTVPFHFLGQPGFTGSTKKQHGSDRPWVHFPGSFLTSCSCLRFLAYLEGVSFCLLHRSISTQLSAL